MGEVIANLKFHSDADKQAWIAESTKWRLPYWDWALRANKGEVPALFTLPNVQIRVPAAADGSQPHPETKVNPLYRYQLTVDGKVTKMGNLPKPYRIDNNDTLPVCTAAPPSTINHMYLSYLPYTKHALTFLLHASSGRNAQAPADGASKACHRTRPSPWVSTTTRA